MYMRQTCKLEDALGNILEDIKDKEKIQVAVEKFLYCGDQKIKIPEILWYIIMYLNIEISENRKIKYWVDLTDCNSMCQNINDCMGCWSGEKLIFVTSDENVHINITNMPRYKIEISKKNEYDIKLKICALFLRTCIYKYKTQILCYVPKEFYRWSMFVLFLFSFDAFFVCFTYSILKENKSLGVVFCDILELILWFNNLISQKRNKNLKEVIKKEDSKELKDVMGFIRWTFRNLENSCDLYYSEFYSSVMFFQQDMMVKSMRNQLMKLIENHERITDEIIGCGLRIKLIHELRKNWLED